MIKQSITKQNYKLHNKSKGEFFRGVIAGYTIANYYRANLYAPTTHPPDHLIEETQSHRCLALGDPQLEGNVIARGFSPQLDTIGLALRQAARTLARTRGSIAILFYLQENDVTPLVDLGTKIELAGADLIRALARLLTDRLVILENETVQLSQFGREVSNRLDKKASQASKE